MNPSPLDNELATRLAAFQILDRLDSIRLSKPPTLLTIFRLYCVQRMTVAQVARRCRCSVGTVSNRLHLMQTKIGIHPSAIKNAPRPMPDESKAAEQLKFELENRG